MTEPRASLTYQFRRTTSNLEITDNYLISRWKKGREHGERRIRLDLLSPDLSLVTSRPEHTEAGIIGGIVVIALAIVVFFSVVQVKIPLLFPFIAAVGIAILVCGLRNLKLQTWTVIQDEKGVMFTYIIHSGCDRVQREAFEDNYRTAFEEMKKGKQPTTESP